jgi:hypothetical protein
LLPRVAAEAGLLAFASTHASNARRAVKGSPSEDSKARFPARLASEAGSRAARKSNGDAHDSDAASVSVARLRLPLLLPVRERAAATASMRLQEEHRNNNSQQQQQQQQQQQTHARPPTKQATKTTAPIEEAR